MNSIDDSTVLPSDWRLVALSELGTWRGGGTPTKSEPKFWNGSVPWVSPKDMKALTVRSSEDQITQEAVDNSAAKIIPEQSVLMVTRSGILRHTFPVSINQVQVTVNQDLKALVPNNSASAAYIAWALRAFEQRILNTCSKQGTTVNSINTQRLKAFQIPVAPFDQQRRIVAEIEKQFSRLDEAVANLQRVKANLERYKAAVLKAAVEGKLTEDWRKAHPDVEPASELLERILSERRAKWEEAELTKMRARGREPKNGKWKSRYKPPRTAEMDERSSDLPDGWAWASIDQLASPAANSITDGPFGSNLKTAHYRDSGPRVIRLQNIKDGYFADERAHITEEHYERLAKHQVFSGDLVIAALGENPPRACLIPEHVGPAVVKADCIRFAPSRHLSASFLNIALNSQPTRKRAKKLLHGVGRPRLSLGEIREIALPVPPHAEQIATVEEAERQLSIVARVSTQVDRALVRAERQRQAILAAAFSGRLLNADRTRGELSESVIQLDMVAEQPAEYRDTR